MTSDIPARRNADLNALERELDWTTEITQAEFEELIREWEACPRRGSERLEGLPSRMLE